MDAAETPTIGDSINPTGLSVRYTPENTLLVDRWFARLPISRGWAIALIGGFFLLVPAILAIGSGYTDIALLHANYRAQFIYAIFLVYVLLIIPILERASERVVRTLRPPRTLRRRQGPTDSGAMLSSRGAGIRGSGGAMPSDFSSTARLSTTRQTRSRFFVPPTTSVGGW